MRFHYLWSVMPGKEREETKFEDRYLWRPTHRAKSRSMNGAQFHLPRVGFAGGRLLQRPFGRAL